jgi:hypothetical protein
MARECRECELLNDEFKADSIAFSEVERIAALNDPQTQAARGQELESARKKLDESRRNYVEHLANHR